MCSKEIDFIAQNVDVLCCPKCAGDLEFDGDRLACLRCRQCYEIADNIPMLFWPNEWDSTKRDVTERMKSFYERNPFPGYDDFDSTATLIEKARTGLFAKLLDDQIPFGTRVLECGCGTGQLTNFLSIASRTVIGTDMCVNSLRIASEFKNRNALEGAHFYQMNLFRPCFKPETFDLVISIGVLHSTSDPFLAFKSISSLVRPNRYVLIGLYHKYGRLVTDLRRLGFRLTKDRLKFLDRRVTDARVAAAKRDSWFMDQYKNPHESKHTIGEVARWLDRTGFVFIHSIPRTVPFSRIDESEKLFGSDRLGNWLERFIVSIGMIFTGHREGGCFIVIGKKSEV